MKKNNSNYPENWPDINTELYHRSVKVFRSVKNLLRVKFELHANSQALEGDIFLFNHFSRFETFIPQYLIFEETGAYSCAIASGEFFEEDNLLSRYLKQMGVFPHDHPHLFPLLAEQILRGRKVIIFPEGSMVKDRQVIDKKGNYSVYSRMTGQRRKLHTGPSVLGQGVEALKASIRHAFEDKNVRKLQHWKQILDLDSLDELLAIALKPTLIVPANITFYPLRISENLLSKCVQLFSENLSRRQAEELLIEGNIMLKETDMDIRMGQPINPCCAWDWRTHLVMDWVAPSISSSSEVYKFKALHKNWKEWLLGYLFTKNAECSRDQYMQSMYANVTINLCHLAATLIIQYIDKQWTQISKHRFFTVLYITIKNLQKESNIHLHKSLLNPDEYGSLITGDNPPFDQFITLAKEAGLMTEEKDFFYFLPKLSLAHDFDQVRIENPVIVYFNEAAPVAAVRTALLNGDQAYSKLEPQTLAAWRFEDEQLSYRYEQETYANYINGNMNGDIKTIETAVADHRPFFIRPEEPNGFGVLLVHGLLASPAETREYGHYLAKQKYTVLGVRIRGHGTSPYALRDLSYEQWFESTQNGFNILKTYCKKILLIGFSTGGALALKLAALHFPEVVGVIAIAVPIKFINPAFMLVSLLHNTNSLVNSVSSLKGIKTFLENKSEHPDINYFNVPIRALYELRLLVEHLKELLPEVKVPTLLLYSDKDPIVARQSAGIVYSGLGSETKTLELIKSKRHGILMENIGGTWQKINEFLNKCCGFETEPSKTHKLNQE